MEELKYFRKGDIELSKFAKLLLVVILLVVLLGILIVVTDKNFEILDKLKNLRNFGELLK